MPSAAERDKLIRVCLKYLVPCCLEKSVPLIKSYKAAVSSVFRLAAPKTDFKNKTIKIGIKVSDSLNRTVQKVKKPFRLFVLIHDARPQYRF